MERYFVFGYVDYECEQFEKHFDNIEEAIEFGKKLKRCDAYYIYNIEMQEVDWGKLYYV